MHIDIQARGFSLTDALRNHTEQSLKSAFGSFRNGIGKIVIRLSDENGPRGGLDKRCTIRADLPGSAPVVVDHHETNLYLAISRAAQRAGRAMLRRTSKASKRRRDSTLLLARQSETESADGDGAEKL